MVCLLPERLQFPVPSARVSANSPTARLVRRIVRRLSIVCLKLIAVLGPNIGKLRDAGKLPAPSTASLED